MNFPRHKQPVISEQHLIAIVERACTIADRLSDRFISDSSRTIEAMVNRRLERWSEVVARGNQEKFARRLQWGNLDTETVRRALGAVQLVNPQMLPGWVDTLRDAMSGAIALATTEAVVNGKYLYLDSEKPLPFEEVLVPFVEVARERLATRATRHTDLISEDAQAHLERSLLRQLVGLFVLPLELEFSIFRVLNGYSGLSHLIGQLQSGSSRQLYTRFVDRLLSDGLRSFFQEYSVLARLASIAVEFWVGAIGEFLERLASDRNELQAIFQVEGELGQVVAAETGLSDPHNCGRAVIILTFASGLKLVYKPKNLGLECAYFDLLQWLNHQGTPLPLQCLRVLNRGSHGWMEFAQASACQDEAALRRFYQRAGMVLCLVYVLRGTDCHAENLIACGEQPILVDLETLLHHRTWASVEDADIRTLANERLQDSVLGTALLPGWQLVPYGQGEGLKIDLGGFGGCGEQETPIRSFTWKCINTDNLAIGQEETKILPKPNRPSLQDKLASCSDYGQELVDGFQTMFHFLMQRKDALLTEDGPIAAFANQKVRLVFRNTSVYFSILQKSLNPKFLSEGVDHSIEFALLSRAFVTSTQQHPFWDILAPEQQALEQLDIPFFTADANSNVLDTGAHGKIDQFLSRPSYEDVVTRIQHLNNTELSQQTSIIQASLYSSVEHHLYEPASVDVDVEWNRLKPLQQEALLQRAIAIGQDLQNQAIQAKDGSVTWIGMVYVREAERFQLQPLNHSLYDGCCGVALFLSALTQVTGKSTFGDLALGALQPLRQVLCDPDVEFQRRTLGAMQSGGTIGLSATVYGLVKIADFLGHPDLLQTAEQVATLLPVNPSSQDSPGILGGAAGAILALLALYEATAKEQYLTLAIVWGQHLLNMRRNHDAGHLTWLGEDGKSLPGFSWGTDGIVYALLRLYTATQDRVFLSAAETAIEGNHSIQAEILELGKLAPVSWCYGVPGSVLAHAGSLTLLDREASRQQFQTLVQRMQRSKLQNVDNLCCGNFGVVDALLTAAQIPGCDELRTIAHQQATWLLARAGTQNQFPLLSHLPGEVFVPSLLQGLAGVGYTLLRVCYPNQVRSILLWQ
jgi:type 2 lantibiotic biosynthesis protein LanM